MAFPTVGATNTYGESSTSTSHAVSLPASISSGDLLVVFTQSQSSATGSISGWSVLYQSGYLSEGNAACFYKTATGSEGATATVTTSGSVKLSATTYRISAGTWSGTPEASTQTTGVSNAVPNPGSLSPSWGKQDTLWLAVAHFDGNGSTVSSYPTNYTNGINGVATGAASGCTGSAQRQLNATSEDPGNFVMSISADWAAYTVGIRPLSGVAMFNLAAPH